MPSRNLVPSNQIWKSIQAVGNPASMERMIVGRLKANMIYAQAAKMITTQNKVAATASPKGIDPALWATASVQPAAMFHMWRTGELSVSIGNANYDLFGIHLDNDQVASVILEWATPSDEWVQLKGGKPTAKWWSLFAVELARLVHDQGVPGDQSDGTVSSLVSTLQTRISEAGVERGPDATSIRPTIELLIQRHNSSV